VSSVTDLPAVPPRGRLVRLGVVLGTGSTERVARLCDQAGIDVIWVLDESRAVALAGGVGRAEVLVLPQVDEPWARTVTVSIGRTSAEATARAELDPTFGGLSARAAGAVLGTLEDGQVAVAALAHAGVTDLRCVLPDVPDLADLVAQLTALAVGSLETHHPDAPRSPDPPPPPWAAPR
jgi:hypothetical protein